MTSASATHNYKGHTIETKIVGYAYARNGNPNPTPRKRFDTPYGSANSLKAAKEIIDFAIESGQPLVTSLLKAQQREMRRI